MDVEILNSSLKLIGQVDTPPSIIWHRKFHEAGVFEIYAPATQNNASLLRTGNFVRKGTEGGRISSFVINKNEDSQEFITATGEFASYLLKQRIINKCGQLSETAELNMRNLVSENCINSENTDRNIENLSLGELNWFTDKADAFVNYDNLYDFICDYSKLTDIGFSIDIKSGKLIFNTHKGSYKPNVVFAREYENLLTASYKEDISQTVNVVTARYSGDMGEVIKTVGVASGLDRYEKYIEGQAITKTELNSNVLDKTATEQSLFSQAENEISPAFYNFEGTVSFASGYKTEYDIGDTVTIYEKKWSLKRLAKIIEVQEVYDETGVQYIPVFQ